ncbi:MAG: phosphoribosyl-ATP diphosphatase [Hyphomicrobiales bacterium]|nr:phosphoribosyl-ATP diphosphatase [Hyphomicrobiales bacterium]
MANAEAITRLAETIRARRTSAADASYTRQLLESGAPRCAKKFGEEAVELVVAALGDDNAAVTSEAADVVYHLLVLLEARGTPIDAVFAELDRRAGVSGLAEKAGREGR